MRKQSLKKKTIRFKRINKIDLTKLVGDMNIDSITTNNLEEFVEQLDTSMQSALDINAPENDKAHSSKKEGTLVRRGNQSTKENSKKKGEDLAKI